MEVKLHKLARTTPAIRLEIKTSQLSYKELSKKYNLSIDTIYKWKKRSDVYDKSHARHHTLSSLSATEEEIVVELRTRLGLSIDDITEVMHRCINPSLSRSAIYRSMKRCGVAQRPQVAGEGTTHRFEEVNIPGYIHMDVKYLTKLEGKRSYLYVAIDRLTRYVYAEILYDLEPNTAGGFTERFLKFFPYKVHKIITDNGFEWTDRCAGSVKEKASGNHPVDKVCKAYEVVHKLTRIRRPQTNGMVERFNRRVNEAIAKKAKISANSGRNSFESHTQRNEFILKFIDGYNRTRLRCLKYNAPHVLLYGNHTEYNTFAGMTVEGE